MEGFEIQVSKAGAKSQPVNSLLLVGLKVRRGKAGGEGEESRVTDDQTVGIQSLALEVAFRGPHCCSGKPERNKSGGNPWAGGVPVPGT